VGRELLLLVLALELESIQSIDRNAVQTIVIVFLEYFSLVIVIVGSAAAVSISVFAIEQALVGVDRRKIISSGLDSSSGVGYQMISNMGEGALHIGVVWNLVVASRGFPARRLINI
jgi:hypothetical protein